MLNLSILHTSITIVLYSTEAGSFICFIHGSFKKKFYLGLYLDNGVRILQNISKPTIEMKKTIV